MNIDKLIKAIQKANPSLLELSFGCEVVIKIQADKEPFRKVTLLNKTKNRRGEEQWYIYEGKTTYYRPESEFTEILGHPITLDHVLVAINENNKWEDWVILKLTTEWQLTKPFSDQPQEVIDFLSEIFEKTYEKVDNRRWDDKAIDEGKIRS